MEARETAPEAGGGRADPSGRVLAGWEIDGEARRGNAAVMPRAIDAVGHRGTRGAARRASGATGPAEGAVAVWEAVVVLAVSAVALREAAVGPRVAAGVIRCLVVSDGAQEVPGVAVAMVGARGAEPTGAEIAPVTRLGTVWSVGVGLDWNRSRLASRSPRSTATSPAKSWIGASGLSCGH